MAKSVKETISDEQIKSLYLDPQFPGSFSGIKTFKLFLASDKGEHVSEKRLYAIIKTIPTYLMHQKPQRDYPRRSYDVRYFGQIVQMDLAFMHPWNGFKYFLLLIDVFSRHIFCEAVKDKTANAIKDAFHKIYEQFESPIVKLESDSGTEFTGNRKYFQHENIYFKTKHSIHKASFAEHAIYLVKRKMYLMLRSELSQNWPKYLQLAVTNLNNKPTKKIGFLTPASITSLLQSPEVRTAQEKNNVIPFKEPSYSEQKSNERNFHITKKGLTVGSYVYLTFNPKFMDKSFDTQVIRYIFFFQNIMFKNIAIGSVSVIALAFV